jgi:hypothetical protein
LRNLLTGAALEGRKAFSYTALFCFKLAMASARSRGKAFAAPLPPAARRPRAVKATVAAPQGDTFASKTTVLRSKATVLGRKVTVSRPKVTVSGVSGQDTVRCVNTPSAGSMGVSKAGRLAAWQAGAATLISYRTADVLSCFG